MFSMYPPTIVHVTCALSRLQLYCLEEVMLCFSFETLIMRLHQNILTINKYTLLKTRLRLYKNDYYCTSAGCGNLYIKIINVAKLSKLTKRIVSPFFKNLKHGLDMHVFDMYCMHIHKT